MTEECSLATRQNRHHPSSLAAEATPPDEIHASSCAVKASDPQPVFNRAFAETQIEKLRTSDDPMLPPS